MSSPNPFSDFDEDFKGADPSNIPSPGRVPPETYKFVCTTQEVKKGNETVTADYEIFVANSGSRGFKLFCEILEPETVPNPKTGEPHITKGVVIERVFWGTKDNLIYMKRDLSTILGRPIEPHEKLSELLTGTTWAGRTFEGVVADEEYPPKSGRYNSRIQFINPWVPKAEEGANPNGPASSSKQEETKKVDQKPSATKPADQKKPDPKPAAKSAGKNDW